MNKLINTIFNNLLGFTVIRDRKANLISIGFIRETKFNFIRAMKYLALIFTISVFSTLQIKAEQFKALVFADAHDTWHYTNVPVVRESFESLAEKHSFDLTFVDTDIQFSQQTFANFDVIVFISANPCELNEKKRKEFEAYIHNGGAIVGVHSSSATKHEPNRWLWWEDVVGRVFLEHPAKQTGVISVVERDFPACYHLPDKWLWTDEWYEFETPFPDSLNVVLTVDEKTYKPSKKHAMGNYHPIAWYHEFEGARIFYTALGHITESYRDADFLQHIYGAMVWATKKNES
jgi:type 1 glutamine amidotransferase